MRIKAFTLQRHGTGIRRHFPCVGNDRIEREIRPAVFGAKDIGAILLSVTLIVRSPPANARCGHAV